MWEVRLKKQWSIDKVLKHSTITWNLCHIKLRFYLNIAAIYYYFAESDKLYDTLENLNYFCRLGTVDFMPTFRELPKMQYLSVIHLTRDIDLSLFHHNRRKYSDQHEAHYSVIFMGFMSFSHSCGASIEFSLSVYPPLCMRVATIEQHNELKRYPILVNYIKGK